MKYPRRLEISSYRRPSGRPTVLYWSAGFPSWTSCASAAVASRSVPSFPFPSIFFSPLHSSKQRDAFTVVPERPSGSSALNTTKRMWVPITSTRGREKKAPSRESLVPRFLTDIPRGRSFEDQRSARGKQHLAELLIYPVFHSRNIPLQ